jgi:esterase/lipase
MEMTPNAGFCREHDRRMLHDRTMAGHRAGSKFHPQLQDGVTQTTLHAGGAYTPVQELPTPVNILRLAWTIRRRTAAIFVASATFAAAVVLRPPAPAQAQTSSSYGRSVALIAAQQASDARIAEPGARSIFLTHGRPTARSVVLFHGLTDSPMQFATLAHLLYAEGDNVYVPRLPRHGLLGGDVAVLAKLSSDELRHAADSAVTIANGLGDSVIVVGLSLGGTMAGWVAQNRRVWRCVLIAPALEAGRIPTIFDRPIIGLSDRLPNITRRDPVDTTRPDREPGYTTHVLAELLKFGRSVLAEATRGAPRTQQMAILVNANDRTVKESSSEELGRQWGRHGANVWLYEIPDSLRLAHNIVDPVEGASRAPMVLKLLRDLAHGVPPTILVRPLPVLSGG